MTDYQEEKPTRPDIKHPSKHPEPVKPMIEQGDAAEGEVGDVSIYATNVAALEKTNDKPKRIRNGLVAGWNRGLKGSEFGPSIGGRPTSLTPELEKELFEHLETGKTIGLSCRLVGIDNSTLTKWRTQEKQGDNPELTRFFIDFAHARAIGEMHMVNMALRGDVKDFSHGPSKSAQWYLERAFGHAYAPRVNMKVEEVGSLTIDAITKVCATKDCGCYEAILGALQELQETRDSADIVD